MWTLILSFGIANFDLQATALDSRRTNHTLVISGSVYSWIGRCFFDVFLLVYNRDMSIYLYVLVLFFFCYCMFLFCLKLCAVGNPCAFIFTITDYLILFLCMPFFHIRPCYSYDRLVGNLTWNTIIHLNNRFIYLAQLLKLSWLLTLGTRYHQR